MADVTAGWSFWRKLTYGLMTALLMLVVLEVVLRLTLKEIGRATIPNDQVVAHVKGGMDFHPYLGWTWHRLPDPLVGLNADGFRYGPLTRKKPRGTWRGFTVGDSQTYGAGVAPDKTYTAAAEVELRKTLNGNPPVQLVNAGISGYGSLQALRLLETRLLDWDPDAIIVDCRTYDTPRENTHIKQNSSVLSMQRLLFYSRVYYALRVVIDRVRSSQPRRMSDTDLPVLPDRIDYGNHDLIADLARQHGLKTVFVDYPVWDQYHSGNIQCLAPPFELPRGAIFVPSCPALLKSGHKPSELFLDNNHPTELGHSIIGRALAETLIKHGVVQPD